MVVTVTDVSYRVRVNAQRSLSRITDRRASSANFSRISDCLAEKHVRKLSAPVMVSPTIPIRDLIYVLCACKANDTCAVHHARMQDCHITDESIAQRRPPSCIPRKQRRVRSSLDLFKLHILPEQPVYHLAPEPGDICSFRNNQRHLNILPII